MNRDEKAGRASWKFPFYYGSESETFSFYRIPKILFSSDLFSGLSTDAKILYGLLMDRMQLSFKNSWLDSEGKVFMMCIRWYGNFLVPTSYQYHSSSEDQTNNYHFLKF